LHPTVYAKMLGAKLSAAAEGGEKINVWLVNTGWTGGGYGLGSRMELTFTRAMIKAALNGDLDEVDYQEDPYFGLSIPRSCPINFVGARLALAPKREYFRGVR